MPSVEIFESLPPSAVPPEMQEVSAEVVDGYCLKEVALNSLTSLRDVLPKDYLGTAMLSGVLDRFGSKAQVWFEKKTSDDYRKGAVVIPLDETDTAYWVTGIYHPDRSHGIPYNFGCDAHWLVSPNHPAIGIDLHDKSVHFTEYTNPEEGDQKHSELIVGLGSNGQHIIETVSISEDKSLDEKNHIQMRVERRRGKDGPGLVLVIKEDDYNGTTTTIHALAGSKSTISMAQSREGRVLDPVGVEISKSYDDAHVSYGNRIYTVEFVDGFRDDELAVLTGMPITRANAREFLLEAARLVWQSGEQARFTIQRVPEYA